MSTPPRPNSTSPTGSPPKTAPLAEPRRYTRFADAGFGHRLADARNLIHTQAPPVPLRQELMTAVGSVASEVANSIRQAAMFPPGAPKHGWEKGSYRSPFDYHIPGHTISNKDTSADRSFTHASRSSVPSFPPLESVTPTDTRTPRTGQVYEMEPESESDSPCRTATPGPDAKERLILLAPLRMLRNTGVALRQEDREKLNNFIDSYMADSLQTVVEHDGILPNVVYKVSIPMTDADWVKYNQLLTIFGFANGVDDMLAGGSDEFDNYTYVVDGTGAEHVEGWKVLASASESDLDMAKLSQELVQVWRGAWIGSGAGYAGMAEEVEQ